MNNDAIGVFGSGVGEVSVIKSLKALLPNENFIYFGDTARHPFGTKSKDTVLKYTNENIRFFDEHKVKLIISACGTSSAIIGSSNPSTEFPFMGILLPSVQAACGATRTGRIGVIGTTVAIKSGAYGKAIRAIRPDTFVVGNPCPMLLPLSESGSSGISLSEPFLKQYLSPIISEKADTLILANAELFAFKDKIAELVGDGVTIISPWDEVAKSANNLLTSKELLCEREENGTIEYFVTDSKEFFEENARLFFGDNIDGTVTKI